MNNADTVDNDSPEDDLCTSNNNTNNCMILNNSNANNNNISSNCNNNDTEDEDLDYSSSKKLFFKQICLLITLCALCSFVVFLIWNFIYDKEIHIPPRVTGELSCVNLQVYDN